MLYPYNAIFGRGLVNTFDVALHLGYLCLKIRATFGVISVFGSQKDTKNIEQCYVKSQSNINNQHAPSKQKLLQNIRNPSKLMLNSKKSL
jgi:hypothetical protein